jgi:hypothetical protein
MADPLQGFFSFFNQYWPYITIGVLGLLVLYFFTQSKKKDIRIDRASIEKKKRIKELAYNGPYVGTARYDWIKHGRLNIGKPVHIAPQIISVPKTLQIKMKDEIGQEYTIDKEIYEAKEGDDLEIVFRPALFGRFANPLKDLQLLRISKDEAFLDSSEHLIVISPKVTIDGFFDQYYTLPEAENKRNTIMAHLYKTEAQTLGNEVYTESQKRSTITREGGLAMALKDKEIQAELAKRGRGEERI